MEKHISVLLNETIEGLNIKDDGIYVDMTLGYGGHSSEVLKRLKSGKLIAFDQDSEAIKYSNERLSKISSNYQIVHNNFVNLKEELNKLGIYKVDGIMFDLGISSAQIDEKERGFSYMQDARLDMRMNQESRLTAYDVVNNYSEDKLTDIFRYYGEEHHARRIAKEIVSKRTNKPIETTLELVDIIDKVIPYREKRNSHPAKKVFQAIRIEVNDELNVLSKALKDALDMLNVNGRICVITFHSLEDRIVKDVFKKYTNIPDVVKGLPNIPSEYLPDYEIIEKKPITPSNKELSENNRSRSSKLRVIERIK
jgi:16S rRNA (cytosine1402-N4)-methyltransferase